MPDAAILFIEKCVGSAHRAMARAACRAELMRDDGLYDDLRQFCIELERLQVDLLKRYKRRSTSIRGRTYLSSSVRDDGRTST